MTTKINPPFVVRPKAFGLYNPQYEKENCGIGFIADLQARLSHKTTLDALEMLARMDHRGGCGCEHNTGDGAGILTNLPIKFFQTQIKKLFAIYVKKDEFAVGNVFLPRDKKQQRFCEKILEKSIKQHGLNFLGWRETPIATDKADIGKTARASQPIIKQIIITSPKGMDSASFERKLYVIRKHSSQIIRADASLSEALLFYICSLSSKIIVYKGMLIGSQLLKFFPDLNDTNYTSYLAMVHSRFSTNTFPSWDRAQPCRYLSHNGEINTRQGNVNWMSAREGSLSSEFFSDQELKDMLPIIETDMSDSGVFDNMLELLIINGRSLPEALAMMIPEAWQNNTHMRDDKRAFYQYCANLIEPWDGPASIIATDGHYICAVLDRNGLRPSRYYLTDDDRIIMASEVGVADIKPKSVVKKGRLRPGRMFVVDFAKGRLVDDKEVKTEFAAKYPYREWLNKQQFHLGDITTKEEAHGFYPDTLIARMRAFGYSVETMQFMLLPLVREGRDPLGSMGNDSALACLSNQPRIIYDYFKQLFAQVTNPAIDSIREEVIMSLQCAIGPETNLLETKAENAHRLVIDNPILNNEELAALKYCHYRNWKSKTIDITYDKDQDINLSGQLTKICEKTTDAISGGYSFIILSDRNVSESRIAISSLLTAAAVHRYLVASHQRTRIGLIVETAEAREVHHFCLLLGYGVDAINPYLAFEALWQARRDGLLDLADDNTIVRAYQKGVTKGMFKVMAKMGISTLHSYKGAQIFEAVGLAPEVIEQCFYNTPSRIKGVSFAVLAKEAYSRHHRAYDYDNGLASNELDNFGRFHWRSGGEKHMWSPETIFHLQQASQTNQANIYWEFAKAANEKGSKDCTLRGLMKFKNQNPIDIAGVEPAGEIVKRFASGAMSFGSISAESHETLAIAMNRIGGKSNSGEGGEDPARWQYTHIENNRRSAIKQVASGRFGVTIEYLNNADELQIKISQGAKPGEGGELPGKKVDKHIARIRHSTPGVGLISPPPHHDIYSIEDLAQLIYDLKHANPDARVSVKLVSESGVGTVAAGVVKAKADHIVIAGHDGGTGASPLTSIKHAGLPWELGVAETHQTLMLNDLRSRVVIQTDGQMKTGRDVAIAALLGAEEYGFSTAPLITLGCIMMRKCHLNTCPVGIATQDEKLRKKFTGKPQYVINYLFMVAEDMRQIMAMLGFRTVNEMIGRTDKLVADEAIAHWKKQGIDLSAILCDANAQHPDVISYQSIKQDHKLDKHIDHTFIDLAQEALQRQKAVRIKHTVNNTDRAVGAMLSSALVKKVSDSATLEDGLIDIKLKGSAGQSLGAFLAKGISISVEGDTNDYVGKGLSGGIVAVYPPKECTFNACDEMIAGNVCAYGATSGQLYLCGKTSERFCVRNSGAEVVVEGIGDHGCEYMTGGRAVILGEIGRNFGAGMSGGIAYIYDPDQQVALNCNLTMIDLDPMDEAAETELQRLVTKHLYYTSSLKAKFILNNWQQEIKSFIKVMPKEYKRILAQSTQEHTDKKYNLIQAK